MAQFSPRSTEGYYLPTTDLYDSQFIYDVDVNSPEFKDYLVRIQQIINTYALFINHKPNGRYETNEQISGNLYFSIQKGQDSQIYRQAYFTTVDCGPLPNATTKAIPHGIVFTNITVRALKIYGAATRTATKFSIPLPFSSPTFNENIALSFDATNVYIQTAIDYSNYDHCYVTLEYLRQ